MTKSSSRWRLFSRYESIDDADDICPIELHSAEHLRAILSDIARGKPTLVALSGPIGHRLFLGIGKQASGVLYYDNSAFVDGQYALPKQPHAQEDAVFISEDSPTIFPASVLMPLENAIEIACEFVRFDRVPTSIEWTLARHAWK